MHLPPAARSRLRILLGVALALAFGGVAISIFASPQVEPVSVISSLSQLTRALETTNGVVASLELEASVFACDANSGALVVTDASGAELLEIDGLDREFQPGDVIRIAAARCLACRTDAGVCLSKAPLLDNDSVHAPRDCACDCWLTAGRHPVRVDWFNQAGWAELGAACLPPGVADGAATADAANLIHVTRAECYEGNWARLPNFQLLQMAKAGAVTNFDISFRTRPDLVGIRFHGYVEIPQSGAYHFTLRSDDGSLLWVDDPSVLVKKIAARHRPLAAPAAIGEPMAGLDERRLATLEGRVSFVSRVGKGLRMEIRSEPNSVIVAIADARSLRPEDLQNAYVRVSGVAAGALLGDRRVALGRLALANSDELAIIESAPGGGKSPATLTTVLQVHSLSTNEAGRHLPVRIAGVVTAVGPGLGRWMAVEDDTRGGFVRINDASNCVPNVGEFWAVTGHTEPGDFAPIIWAEKAELLGKGKLPDPSHPTWNQLANGSMDVQWAEVQGLVTGARSNWLSLLLPEGRQEVRMEGWGESDLRPFEKAVVRVRGALFALWNAQTHEVQVGSFEMRDASLTVDKPAPGDPFDAPEKTPRGLFLFDAKASPFQRVKVRGQVTYRDSTRLFIERGAAIEVIPENAAKLKVGEVVEAVGYPDLSGVSPQLRQAIVRKIKDGALAAAPLIVDDRLGQQRLASRRIRIKGSLAAERREEGGLILQIQTRSHLFPARVANAAALHSLRLGSELSLTGICHISDGNPAHFELLVNAPDDIAVVSKPSWWTLPRLLSVLGALLATLLLAGVWITLLRRQVAQRTFELQREIRERERAERRHALEAERSRIARDLHDDLGSSLTEINVLATTGQRPRAREIAPPALFKAIADKARGLIAALDVIVWAVDPEDNSLQSLADYLGGYASEYLSNSSVPCRLKIPVTLPDVNLDGDIRHELLMVIKETMNNIVRHAEATEVEFQINVADNELEITVADNGRGFDPRVNGGGHGLKNRATRLRNVGGSCHIESIPDQGTTVWIRLPLPTRANTTAREANTTHG